MHILVPKDVTVPAANSRNKKYLTEICLLVKTNNASDLDDWLTWHLEKIGIEHIHIYDNESVVCIPRMIKKWGDRVSYTKVEGTPHQADIYTKHIGEVSEARFVIPLDDDEYIFSGVDFNEYVKSMELPKFALRSILFVPKKPTEKRHGGNVFELCDHIALHKCRENREVKCMVDTTYRHLYFDVKQYEDAHKMENGLIDYHDEVIGPDDQPMDTKHNLDFNYTMLGNVHNPITLDENGNRIDALDINLNPVYGFMAFNNNTPSDIFIAHMKIRSKEEWDWKCDSRKVVADMDPAYYDTQRDLYSEVYEGELQKFTGFKELYK